MSDLGEWDDEPEISDQSTGFPESGRLEAEEAPEPEPFLPGLGQLCAGTSLPVLPTEPRRHRPHLVPLLVETRRSHQPAGSTLAGVGIPPSRQINGHERVVAGPR